MLSVYLADRSQKERSNILRNFLAYIAQEVIEEALGKMYSKVRLEHDREQGEAHLDAFYSGYDPSEARRKNKQS